MDTGMETTSTASERGDDSSSAPRRGVPVTRHFAQLPATTPFVGPEAIERRLGRPLTLRLGANESAFGPSPRAQAAMRAAVDQIAYYGDPDVYDLRAALAALHGVALEQVGVASGIDELLGLLVRVTLDRGETAVMSLGGYPTFAFHVVGYGGALELVPYRDDACDLDALAEAARRVGARLVYLANPDNPSGSWRTAQAVHAFLDRLPEGSLLLLDEAYSDFAPPDALPPLAMLGASDPRLVRLRTFSKAHGMAGARVGYILAPAEVIQTLDKARNHFGVNRIGQAGALASLADLDYVRGVAAEVARGREEYAALASELGLVALPSATNFVLIDVGGAERARALVEALALEGVFIRMPGAAPLNRCIRVTVGAPQQRAEFAALFRRVWERQA